MSNTQLIYVSKETAEIANDNEGSFTNQVDNGIVVKVGDEISVEAIAINSVGVGAEIIEIPKSIKNYNYKTNAMCLNCAMYIHHNRAPFTVMMPLAGMNTINTTTTDATYGYMENGGTFPPAVPFSSIKQKYTGSVAKLIGHRFYLGSYIFNNGQNPIKPTANPTGGANANDAVPSIGVFEFFRSDMIFEVATGYDNPANIANKITQDFHAGNITPQFVNLNANGGAFTPYAQPNIGGGNSEDLGVWTEDTCCMTALANPPAGGLPTNFSPYQSTLGYSNPFYAYYGSRLLCDSVGLGGSGVKHNGWLTVNKTGAGSAFSNCIYSLDELDNTGGNTLVANNAIITLNIPYTFANVKLVRDFIHSQKQFEIGATSSTAGLNTRADIRELVYSNINWGRTDDSVVDRTAEKALVCPLLTAGQEQISSSIEIVSLYDPKRWGKFFIQTARAGEFKVLYDYEVVSDKGFSRNPQQLSQFLDCMILPIDTGTYLGAKEINIGIVMNAFNKTGTLYKACDYCFVDMGFMNILNPCLMVCADKLNKDSPSPPTVVGDYINSIQIGAPNMNVLFDETRGRFALQNMCWGNMAQNPTSGTTTNPQAGENNVAINYDFGTQYEYSGGGDAVGYKYGQSGLGILDISVLDDDYNKILIDYNDESDIKEKYNNSLLSRLGFTYNQLTNRNGRPDALFVQRTYESNKPVRGISMFPYPLTNNLRFDTSIDEGLSNNGSGGLPMFDLAPSAGFACNVSTESDSIYALQLPKKLENPFWLIKSDIIDGVEFNSEKSGGGRQNVLAVCNRAYLAGDFAFSFQTSYAFKATKEFVITGIKTQILNPDLTPADINNATTIVYKVVSPIPFFTAQAEAEEKKALKK